MLTPLGAPRGGTYTPGGFHKAFISLWSCHLYDQLWEEEKWTRGTKKNLELEGRRGKAVTPRPWQSRLGL